MKLSPQSNSGESGTATLIKQGEKTGNAGFGSSCAQVVNGMSDTVVNASLDDLQKGYAIKRREWRSRLLPRARSTARGRRREPSKRHHESSASSAYALPIHYLRTLADSRRIIEAARGARRAVVLGASFIGLEGRRLAAGSRARCPRRRSGAAPARAAIGRAPL